MNGLRIPSEKELRLLMEASEKMFEDTTHAEGKMVVDMAALFVMSVIIERVDNKRAVMLLRRIDDHFEGIDLMVDIGADSIDRL